MLRFTTRMAKRQKDIITTKDGQRFRVKVTYEIIAVKSKKYGKGQTILRGRYTTRAAAVKRAKSKLSPPKRKRPVKALPPPPKEKITVLKNFQVVTTTERKALEGQVGGLFGFTYQLNGKTYVHDKMIESYSTRTAARITDLNDREIRLKLAEAERFATIQFLQEKGLETANITLVEFIPPIKYKYYMPN